jgi:hypothetical protein
MNTIDITNTKNITVIIILCIILFAIIYLYQNGNSRVYNISEEGFANYNINATDTVGLAALDNVLVGNSGITLTNALNTLIDARNTTSGSMYAKASDIATINTNIGTNTSSITALTTQVNTLRDTLSSNIATINGKFQQMSDTITANNTTQNAAITTATALQNTAIQNATASQTTALQTAITNMNTTITDATQNTLQYVGGFTWAPYGFLPNYSDMNPSGGRRCFERPYGNAVANKWVVTLFNWKNPELITNLNTNTGKSPSLLPLLPNTYYLFTIGVSLWATGYNKVSIFCLDNNNNNDTSISKINNNNSFYWNFLNQHLTVSYSFLVKTSANNPNIVIGLACNDGIWQDANDYFSISINKIINPTNISMQ